MEPSDVLPDLQACVVCEDVRQELNGLQSLVGVVNVIPARAVPVGFLKLCVWTRWCSGLGKYYQTSRIIGVDESQVLAESQLGFELKEIEGNVTNVNLFTGVQFQSFGIYSVEILLSGELVIRFPLPVVKV